MEENEIEKELIPAYAYAACLEHRVAFVGF